MKVKFDQLRIATRLRLGFAVMVLMLVLVSGLGVGGMAANQQRMDEITGVNSIKSTHAIAMRDSVYERMVALRNMALVGSQSEMEREMETIRLQQAKYLRAEQQLGKLLSGSVAMGSREKIVLAKIQAVDAAARPLIEKAAQLAMASQADQFYTLLVKELLPVQTEWMSALADLVLSQQRLSEHATNDAQAAYESARLLMLIMGVAAILVAVVVSVILARSMLGQLGGELSYATSIAEKIAGGDLSITVTTRDQDRTSLLAAMKTMRDSLAKIVSNVRRNTETIAVASSQIAAGNVDLSVRTQEQARSMEETTALMAELTRAVVQNAENAELANGIVNSAADAAIKGGQVVEKVVHTMDAVNAAAKRITDIVGVIDSIAFQTNILALNAAVEAARAGEQGLGFAVVAAEVRALAQRSANAAREIDGLIGESVDKMALGTQLVGQAGRTMDEVVAGVKRAAQLMAQIAVASQSQSKGIAHVGSAVNQMDRLTRQNAALVGQTAAAAAGLQEHAAELAHSVSLFKTSSSAAVPQRPMALAAAAIATRPSAHGG